MGTPEFAVKSLEILVENGHKVVGVITAPDKPQGRGKRITPSPVKQYALEAGLTIWQPPNLKNQEFLDSLKALEADLQVVVAFRMLPRAVWEMPPLGTLNLHASLLPDYRGAAPINWAIINGEKETGISTFFLKHEIDTGEIIFQEKEEIAPDETAGSLHDKLMVKGARLILKTVIAIQSGDYPRTSQKEMESLSLAPKIFRDDCLINWNQSAEKVRNHIRGLSPYPAAWTKWNDKVLKVFEARIRDKEPGYAIGHFYTDGKSFIRVNTLDYALELMDLQMEGKKRMPVEELLRGIKV